MDKVNGWERVRAPKDVDANYLFLSKARHFITSSSANFYFLLNYIVSCQPHTHPCDFFSLSLLPLTFTRLYVPSFGSLLF